ncbi:hypothetical protein Tco_0459079 [Tanacetum coccineum]
MQLIFHKDEAASIPNEQRQRVGSQVVQQTRIQCFKLQGIWALCKGMQEAKGVKTTRIHKEQMNRSNITATLAKIQEGAPENPVLIVSHWNRTNLDETGRALGEATSCRDSCLIALQNKQNELEKYIAFNDQTIDYDILQTKLNETLGLLARKDIDIKEGQLKEKSKVISDLKVKEGRDIDKMIEMDKQIMFLNEILYKRNLSIQTIHIFCPSGEETVTLEKESRLKLNKDTVKPYDYTYQNSLYEIFKPPSKTYLDQLERAKEVRKTMWRKTTKKPNVVPIDDSKPKRKANKSVVTTHKKTVVSDTTIQKPKSYFKELYENTNSGWKWWIEIRKCLRIQMRYKRPLLGPSLKWNTNG